MCEERQWIWTKVEGALALLSCIANALGDKGGKTVRYLEVRLTGGRSEYVRGVREPHLLAVLPSAFSYWRYSSGGI